MTRTAVFAREQLRTPFTLVLLVAVPAFFVAATAGVLSDFARALGGRLAGNAAAALAAGWSAAFVAGTLGFFQATASRGADRRLALAGAGAGRVTASRITASIALAVVAAAAGFVALLIRQGVVHPWHAAPAVMAFALIYLAIGILIGAVISGPLEGSLAVAFVFLLDVFSGPGMAPHAAFYSVSRKAAELLISAATGQSSPASDWIALGGVVVVALFGSFALFAYSARSRG